MTDGDLVQYWQNKANPSKNFSQDSSTASPTYYASLSAVNLENQYTFPTLRYFGTPGNEFVFNKEMTVIMLCSITRQKTIATGTVDRRMFELSAANVVSNQLVGQPQTSMYVPLLVSENVLGWTGTPDSYGITIGSGINQRWPSPSPGVGDQRNNYNYRNACQRGLDISQNISEAYMITSRLADNFLVNLEGLNRTNAIDGDGTLLNYQSLGGSPIGILKAALVSFGQFTGAIYEILVYDRALSFEELNDIQNYFYRKWTPVGVKIKRDVYPENSGNWSTMNWSIGSEPSPWNTIRSTDEVYTNEGYLVNIDTDIHVDSLVNKNLKDINNILAIGTGNNGTFNLTNGVSITADLVSTSANHYWITLSPAATATINGSFYGGYSTPALRFFTTPPGRYASDSELQTYLTGLGLVEGVTNSAIDRIANSTVSKNKVYALSADGTCSLTINGNIVSASKTRKYLNPAGQGYRPVFWNSTAPLFLNGDIIARGVTWNSNGSGNITNLNRVYHIVTSGPFYMKGDIYPSRVYNNLGQPWNFGLSSSNVTYLTGNVYTGTGDNGWSIINSNGALYIEGNLETDFGSPNNNGRALICSGNSKTFIKGNVLGSKIGVNTNTTNVYALQLNDNSYCSIVGDVYGGVGNRFSGGILLENTASLMVSGNIHSLVGPGIFSNSVSAVSAYYINEGINHSGGEYSTAPIIARKMFLSDAPNNNKKFTKFQKTDGDKTFYWTDQLTFSHPLSADVKYNLLYGPSYSLSGSMHIPETSAVAWDIPIKTDVRINKLIPGERYEIISIDPFVPFTDFGAESNIPGVTFVSTGSSTRGGLGIARTLGKSVVTTVDIMRENINNMDPGSSHHPTWRTFLDNNITHFETISSLAKCYNYFTKT
jgi:hypothetical protein